MIKKSLRRFRDLLTMDVRMGDLKRIVNGLGGGPFRLVHLEGKGSYTVFCARARDNTRRYIVKVSNSYKGGITKDVIENRRTQYIYLKPPERFERENRTLGILSKNGLGPSPVVFNDRYSVEEYISGEKFSDEFAQAAGEGLALLKDVFSAVSAMHSLGVFHGDLRPYNILVDGRRIRFIDFEHMLDPKKFTERQMRAFDFLILLHELVKTYGRPVLEDSAACLRGRAFRLIPESFDKEDVVKIIKEFDYDEELCRCFF